MTGGNHKSNWVSTFPFFRPNWSNAKNDHGFNDSKGDVEIGSDVWLAQGSTILSGVKIGHGAIVAAEAVVTKDVPPYAIVAGNPARIVRFRFDMEVINRLLNTRWWLWNDDVVNGALPIMEGEDIKAFLRYAESLS